MHLFEIPYKGEYPAAVEAIADILPPEELNLWGQVVRQQRFTASLISGVLHVQIPESEVSKSDEIEAAIAAL